MAKETGMVAIYATWNARTFDVAVLRWRWKKIGALQLLQLSCLSFCMLFVFCMMWFVIQNQNAGIQHQKSKIQNYTLLGLKIRKSRMIQNQIICFLIFLKYQEKYTPLKAQINYRFFFERYWKKNKFQRSWKIIFFTTASVARIHKSSSLFRWFLLYRFHGFHGLHGLHSLHWLFDCLLRLRSFRQRTLPLLTHKTILPQKKGKQIIFKA